MQTFKKWAESLADKFSKNTSGVDGEHLNALEKAVKLAFERYPSQVKGFFRSLDDSEITDLCGDLERSPKRDKAAELFGGKRFKDADEVVPPKPDQGSGEMGD